MSLLSERKSKLMDMFDKLSLHNYQMQDPEYVAWYEKRESFVRGMGTGNALTGIFVLLTGVCFVVAIICFIVGFLPGSIRSLYVAAVLAAFMCLNIFLVRLIKRKAIVHESKKPARKDEQARSN